MTEAERKAMSEAITKLSHFNQSITQLLFSASKNLAHDDLKGVQEDFEYIEGDIEQMAKVCTKAQGGR